MKLFLLIPDDVESRLSHRMENNLFAGAEKYKPEVIYTAEDLEEAIDNGELHDCKLIFAVDLDEDGINLELMKMLRIIGRRESALEGSVGGVIVDGAGDLYTKDIARKIVYTSSMAGCTFPGKALVEATGSLNNFTIQAKNFKTTLAGAYRKACVDLVEKVMAFQLDRIYAKKLLVVHASSRKTSNSLSLWSLVKEHLEGEMEIEEISIRNGEVWDCRGCKYEQCLHFGENSRCFYGGVMVDKVYPAIKNCDGVVLICPNYNDSVSANIMAFINRLTALFRTNDFSKKEIYALVVSGYSGGDLVAQQILGAMNMNKNFILPKEFALMATANDPGSVMKIENIEDQARDFAYNILKK